MEVLNDKEKLEIKTSPVRKRPGVWYGVFAVVLIAAIVWAVGYFRADKGKPAAGADGSAASKVSGASEKAVISVRLLPVQVRPVNMKLLVSGTVWSWDHLTLGSEVGGLKVDGIFVEEGDRVKKGQVLATLQSSILKAQLEREKARALAASASLAKSIQPNRPEDLTALKAAYAQAQAAVAQEEANLVRAKANMQEAAENARRYRWLVAQGAVSAQEADARETQSKVAAADVRNMEERVKASRFSAEQSQQRLSMGLTGGRSEDIAIAKAQKLEIEATIKQLQSQIDQTVIKAPCDGIVMKRHVHLGEIALNNKTMFEIVRDGRLELKAQVPEKDLLYVKEGQPVEMTGDSGKTFKGRVREISPLVEQETRLGTVRIDIDSCPDLKPGNFLRGEILIGKENVATLPTSCVTYKGNRPLVYQIEESQGGSRARMLYVQLGARDGAFVQVLNGLKAGDMVVERGGGFLKDGDPVRVLSGNAQSQP